MLLKELDNNIIQLEKLIKAINKTNSSTYIENESTADIIAKRDAIGLKLSFKIYYNAIQRRLKNQIFCS